MEPFLLSIITHAGKIFEDQVTTVIVPAAQGSLGILANHAPMVSQLILGVVALKLKNVEKFYAIDSGAVEVNPQHEVAILADQAIECTSLDEAKEKLQNFSSISK